MADLDRVHTSDAPEAIGPYSQAIVSGNLVFTAGQIALDPTTGTGELVSDDVAEQTDRVLRNLRAILEAAGAGLDTVLKTTVFLADLRDYATVNEVYGRFFADHAPARSAVEVAGLPKGARVEIEAVARLR